MSLMPRQAETMTLPAGPGSTNTGLRRHKLMLPLLLAGQAMAAMDTSIANVAAPAMRADLGITGALLQMAVAGYVLAYAVFLITGARMGDDHGYRRMFMIGVGLFTLSSLACGLAPSTTILIIGRVAQGLGAALLVPQVLSLIQRHFDGPERAKAIAYYSMILGLGSTAGQLLGGIIITYNVAGLSWRPAFLINVPVGLFLLTRLNEVLPDTKGPQGRKLDLVGVASLSLSMMMMVVPLTFGPERGWPAWTGYVLGLGLVGLGLFLKYEHGLALRGGSPLLNLAAVVNPGIRPGLAVISIGFIGYGGWLFATALYLQSGLGFSPMISGAVFAAYAFGFGIANVNWSKLPARYLRWTPAAALLVMVLANLGFGLTAVNAGWLPWVMVPLLFLAGSSHGLTFGTTVNQMTLRTTPIHAPILSGLVTTSVQLSIVMGIAALGSLYLGSSQGGPQQASIAMSHVTLSIAAGALVAIACSLRLATVKEKDQA